MRLGTSGFMCSVVGEIKSLKCVILKTAIIAFSKSFVISEASWSLQVLDGVNDEMTWVLYFLFLLKTNSGTGST